MSPLPDRMRIAVMGSGAVGGYFGARLAAAGADVTFVARGEHLRAMQHHGLRITSAQGPLEVSSKFVAAPDQAAPVDLVLFSVKSQDTESAARALGPFMGSQTLVLSLSRMVWTMPTRSRGSGVTSGAWPVWRTSSLVLPRPG